MDVSNLLENFVESVVINAYMEYDSVKSYEIENDSISVDISLKELTMEKFTRTDRKDAFSILKSALNKSKKKIDINFID